MQGILIVNKPKGMTSHDVVAFVRRTFAMRQVGHTGTLDPDAEGVLPVLIGRATKLSDLLTADEKSYTARVQLGIITDTYDMSGTVRETGPVNVSEQELSDVLREFLGKQKQIPPMYSAIKMNGKKLYQLARQGVEIERPPREITVRRLQVRDFDTKNNSFSLEIDCSKGTYIRSLCHDIGQRLGCGACMAELVRTRSGSFTIEQSFSPEEIAQKAQEGCAEEILISIEDALCRYPKLAVSEENATKIRNGLRLRTEQLGLAAQVGDFFRLYDRSGLFCLISVIADDAGTPIIKLEKTFFS